VIFGVLMALALVLGYLFLKHERTSKEPIIDLAVLKGRPFQAANYFNLIYGVSILGVMAFIPFYATSVLGMSTLASGLILTPRSVGQMVSSIVTSMMLPKWGYRRPMLIGTILAIVCLILMGFEFSGAALAGLTLSAPLLLGTFMFFSGLGSGMVAPASNNACIELMPNRVATITGVRGMFRQMGSGLCIAISAMVLENFEISTGFRIVFFGLAILLVLSLPFIFAMPRSAEDTCNTELKTQSS
jgi:Na+/melibiose symporter-like transporter